MSNLSSAINAYSAETGVVAVLSADKATVYLTQDEGLDIKLTDLDFATTDDSKELQVTGMDARIFDSSDRRKILSGSAKSMYDTSHSSGSNKDVIIGGQILMHSSHTFTATTAHGDGDDEIFESSPGAASLDKVSRLESRTRSGSINALKKSWIKHWIKFTWRAKLAVIMSRMDQAIDNLTNVSTKYFIC